ncbi:VanZ family protein [Chitinimonas sp.]|uniref:VanZ family protein n=1 Tax=Chitinimonas sp. TaxID=1934313 RepID=UPI002F9280AB
MNKPSPVRRDLGIALGVLYLLVIAYGSLMHNPPSLDVPEGDKWQHLAGYAVLAGWWVLTLPHHRLAVWLGAAGYGVLMECLQGLTDYRSFDVLDMLANGTGALLGLAGASLLLAWYRRHKP